MRNQPKTRLHASEKFVALLKSFTVYKAENSVIDISNESGIPRSTLYRILADLVKGGLLEKNPRNGKYKVGAGLYFIGSLYLRTTDVLTAAKPVMETLNELTSEAINLSVLDKGHVTYVMKEETRHAFRWAVHIGTSLPAYASATGKALLSELTEKELDGLYPEERLAPLTKETIATKTELKLELELIRKTGVAFDREGGNEGVEGIASVIRNSSGKWVAAMSVAVPTFRINKEKRELLSKIVRMGCILISYRLGYQDGVESIHDLQEIGSWWKQSELGSVSWVSR